MTLKIPENSFELTDGALGWGNFGAVMLATLKPGAGESESPREVVAKRLLVDKERTSSADVLSWIDRETRVWLSCSHENILKFIGYHAEDDLRTVYLFSTYMHKGNVRTYLKEKQSTIEERLSLVEDTLMGLDYLHSHSPPIVHGNLRATKVLINDNGRAVLGDIGLYTLENCIELVRLWGYQNATPWSSPESLSTSDRTTKSDIWAWGCLALEMMTGKPPYYSVIPPSTVAERILSGQTPEPRPPPENWPNGLLELVRKCWSKTPKDRPHTRTCVETLNLAPWSCEESFQRPKAQERTDRLSPMLDTDSDANTGTEEQRSANDDISSFITTVSSEAIHINGRFGDVFKGTHKTTGEVALKRLRIGGGALDEQVIRRFEREADTWRRLDHPYVLRFLGTYKSGAHLYFVSPFAKNGTLLEYVNDRPDINRVRLLVETSDAVNYLHGENIVHGDIKGSNLLISNDGHVLLCDFGLAKPTYAHTSTALKGAGTFRWQSPELWDNEPRTFASDVYAFSMTIVEVLTGDPPFPHLMNELAVLLAVYQKDERPQKIPLEFNGVSYENTWKVAEACWSKIPGDRIPMSEAFRLLRSDPSLS